MHLNIIQPTNVTVGSNSGGTHTTVVHNLNSIKDIRVKLQFATGAPGLNLPDQFAEGTNQGFNYWISNPNSIDLVTFYTWGMDPVTFKVEITAL